MAEVSANHWSIYVSNLAAQLSEHPVVNLVFSKITQSLNYGAAFAACGGHIPRCGVLKKDTAFADFHLSGGAVREEHNTRGHLFGEAQYIGGISTRWLKADGIPNHQRSGDGIGRRGDHSQIRILGRVVVNAAGKLADAAGGFQPVEGEINSGPAAQVLEVLGGKYPAFAMAMYSPGNL